MLIHRLLMCFMVIALAGCSPSEEAQVTATMPDSNAANEALIREVLELIDQRQLDAAFELYAEDYIYHGPGGMEIKGRDGIRGLWMDFLNAFPDLRSTVDDMVIQGDKLVLRWTIRGTHTGEFLGVPPSHNPIALPITEIFRIADGQLVEAWDQWDRLHLFAQIGGIPESMQVD